MANKYNVHTQFYTNKKVVPGPQGILTGKNHNIQRGGGYGFNPKGTPGFGVMPIKSYSNCSTDKQPAVVHSTGPIGKQHVHSPPPQRGGGKACCAGGTPYYGFTGKNAAALGKAGVTNYPPITAECHAMCGGTRRRRRRRKKRNKRNKRNTRRRRTRRRHTRRRRRRKLADSQPTYLRSQ